MQELRGFHRFSENALPHKGHASLRSGNRRSGAHMNTLGCKTRRRTSSHVIAPSPSALFRECISSARRVSSAGCTQGPPVRSAQPVSIFRATARTAFFFLFTVVVSAPARMLGSRSVARAGGATLGLASLREFLKTNGPLPVTGRGGGSLIPTRGCSPDHSFHRAE